MSVGFAGARQRRQGVAARSPHRGVFGGIGWLLARRCAARRCSPSPRCSAPRPSTSPATARCSACSARAPFALAEDPLLRSRTDRLAAALGVSPPKLYLIDDGFPRAFAVGRGPRSSSLAVSTGLLAALAPDELDAVLAHELAHVRTRDVLTQTFAVLLAATLVEASRIGGLLSRALLFVLAPVAAAFTHLLLSPKRELRADALAAPRPSARTTSPTRSPAGRGGRARLLPASPATEPLYAVNPSRRTTSSPGCSRRTRRWRGECLRCAPRRVALGIRSARGAG